MKALPRFTICTSCMLAATLWVAGSHLKLIPAITSVSAAASGAQDQASPYPAPPDQGQDPAAVNLAPSGPSYTTQAPPPPDQSAASGQYPDDSGYAEQPTEMADQAPPPLPDYDQPPPPADGYIWTPGYWAWGPGGYYWVPGAWVEPPYMGALWTPGYWGFYSGRYRFYPGHWGRHIGFYGGINYGFGYIGFGYEGGYWNANRFFYNRAYNHIDERSVHNVYNYNAGNRRPDFRGSANGGNNNYDNRNNGYNSNDRNNGYNRNNSNNYSRPSYRGGPGGVQATPLPSEASAWHEPTTPRMNSQVQHAQTYSSVRGQAAAQNHGRPATPAVTQPLPADRNVRPPSGGQQGGQHQHQPH